MASVPQVPGVQQLVELTGDERFEVISAGGIKQVITLQQIADFVGGGPVTVLSVPNGGTGLSSLTLNGILYGNGTNPVGVTAAAAEGNVLVTGPGGVPQWTGAPGTAGQVLTSAGAGAVPTFQNASGGYPPSPVPNMQTFLQNAVDNGDGADWIWGDYVAAAPILVTMNGGGNDLVFNFHGAHISPGFTNTSEDVLTFAIQNSAPTNTEVAGFAIHDLTVYGVNTGGTPVAQNCITISCASHANGIYGVQFYNVSGIGCAQDGIQFYGAVFEADLYGCFCRGAVRSGLDLRNPSSGAGGGVISSINIHGGDLRVNGNFSNTGGNGYGLLLSADTAFQEPSGVFVYSTNFIGNCSAGIFANSGIRMVIGCHFENNCSSNGAETNGAVWVPGGGGGNLLWCDAAHSTGNGQTYLLQAVGGGLAHSIFAIYWSYSFNEDTDTGEVTAKVTGAGGLYVDASNSAAGFIGPGAGWNLFIEVVTQQLI